MLKLEWKQMLLWKLMKVPYQGPDQILRPIRTHRRTVGPGIPNSVIPQIMAISANEVMAIESVRGACQQMGVKEFFQFAICVGVKNDSYLF